MRQRIYKLISTLDKYLQLLICVFVMYFTFFIFAMTLSLLTLKTGGCSAQTQNASFKFYVEQIAFNPDLVFCCCCKKLIILMKIDIGGERGLTLHFVLPGFLEGQE